MNQEPRVFILKVFIWDDRKPHRYPEFSIYPIEAFCFLTLEECISKVSDYGPGDYGYCYVVESHSCGIDMYFGTKERWLFLPDGTLFSPLFTKLFYLCRCWRLLINYSQGHSLVIHHFNYIALLEMTVFWFSALILHISFKA